MILLFLINNDLKGLNLLQGTIAYKAVTSSLTILKTGNSVPPLSEKLAYPPRISKIELKSASSII